MHMVADDPDRQRSGSLTLALGAKEFLEESRDGGASIKGRRANVVHVRWA